MAFSLYPSLVQFRITVLVNCQQGQGHPPAAWNSVCEQACATQGTVESNLTPAALSLSDHVSELWVWPVY